jgi:hypothetical protein
MAKAKTTPDNTNNYWYEMQVLPTQTITKEQEKSIIAKIAKKHNVSPGKVRFTTKVIYPNGEVVKDTALNAEMINNIKDPKFQQHLFKKYIEENGVKDYNWEEILNIDSRVNALINYDAYEKSRRFVLRYAKWSNFCLMERTTFLTSPNLADSCFLRETRQTRVVNQPLHMT